MIDINLFLKGYIDAALWSTTDCRDEAGNDVYSLDDHFSKVSNVCYIAMMARCSDFVISNYHKLEAFKAATCRDDSDIGHDFWLTSAGHGAGFWDRGAGQLGDELSDASEPYGNFDIYGDFDLGVVRSHHYG